MASLSPYRSPITNRDGLNLDLNENTAGCSPRVLARLRSLTERDVSLYPNRETGERRIADFLELDPAQVLLTNGIDDALLLLFAAYLDPGDELILADPTFLMYFVYGQALGANIVRIDATEDLSFPAGQVLDRISSRTRAIAIANPNNPTGMVVSRADLLRVIQAAPNAAVLVDEAYFEFHGETLVPELADHSNLFIARTFSKAYGMAGLRLGLLAGAREQIDALRGFCSPFNVSVAALACLDEALADCEFVGRYVSEIKFGRERLSQACRELGLWCWPSRANFVLVRVGNGAKAFAEDLAKRRIRIRDLSSSPGCSGCVRITVPTESQMDTLLSAIRESIAEQRR